MDGQEKSTTAGDACESCALHPSRRQFVGQVLGVLATLGIAGPAAAMPVSWTRAARRVGETHSYPVPTADGAQIDRDAEVILVRWQGLVYAFDLSCPHQNTALRWVPGNGTFQCPKHHSQYRPDGTFIRGRATRGMDRYPLRREGAQVVVDTTARIKQPEQPAAWAAAVVKV